MAPTIIDKFKHALHLDKKEEKEHKEVKKEEAKEATPAAPELATESPKFKREDVTVVFVLGGPGAGKGTQCAFLVQDYGFCHLSAGDLLRAEQDREGSQYGDLIKTCIREGSIVPMEVTVALLANAMTDALSTRSAQNQVGWENGKGRFLIDGFPRKMDQAEKFEQSVCVSSLTLFYETSEEVMLGRLLKRGETSGRADDNIESIKKRFVTYRDQTMPVIEHYEKIGRVAKIDSSVTVDEVHEASKIAVGKLFETSSTAAAVEAPKPPAAEPEAPAPAAPPVEPAVEAAEAKAEPAVVQPSA
ncbi:UMP-CMP kinase [Peniophora sp. CONT]|nr:UMP-CMP kinase [Peniophora sp. CONT]